MSNKNIFYAVSTGPANSDYLTLKAVKILNQCKSIFYPITKSENKETHIAFDCIKEVIDISNKNCIGVTFSMTNDKAKTQAEYDSFIEQVQEELQNGDVAFIAIGDVSIYSTAARFAKMIESNGYNIKFISGVTSFCASACECALDLAETDKEIRIIPGDAFVKSNKLDEVLKSSGTKIFMKSPRHLKSIIEKIIEFNLCESSYLIQGVGYESQKIFSKENLLNLDEEVFKKAYMSVLIITN